MADPAKCPNVKKVHASEVAGHLHIVE